MSTRSAIVTGTGMRVPERVLTNHDLEKIVDTSDEWITTRTGIKERRIASDGDLLSDYCVDAGRQALNSAGIEATDISLLLVATVTPDMPIPATACTVQHKLGCRNATAFDLSAGCSGYIYAQSVAKQFILSGRHDHVLVIGAEFLSRFLDWKDRTTCVIFADGAGATVMSAGELPRGVLSSAMHTDGSMDDFISMPGGGCAHPPTHATVDERLHFIRMRGNETFKMAVRSIEEVCREVLDNAGLSTEDVDWFVPHQANQRIITAAGNRLGIPEDRCYVNIEKYGNTSAASIPIALHEAVVEDNIQAGDVVLMAAFGAGLTWAGSVVRW